MPVLGLISKWQENVRTCEFWINGQFHVYVGAGGREMKDVFPFTFLTGNNLSEMKEMTRWSVFLPLMIFPLTYWAVMHGGTVLIIKSGFKFEKKTARVIYFNSSSSSLSLSASSLMALSLCPFLPLLVSLFDISLCSKLCETVYSWNTFHPLSPRWIKSSLSHVFFHLLLS